jgi:hypothetical protein
VLRQTFTRSYFFSRSKVANNLRVSLASTFCCLRQNKHNLIFRFRKFKSYVYIKLTKWQICESVNGRSSRLALRNYAWTRLCAVDSLFVGKSLLRKNGKPLSLNFAAKMADICKVLCSSWTHIVSEARRNSFALPRHMAQGQRSFTSIQTTDKVVNR